METTLADNLEEQKLIDQARTGDVKSFSALVRLYERRALHIAWSFLGQAEDARDAAQEAFIKAYENLGRFRGESRFSTWFYRILINTCKDFLRKKKSRPVFDESEENNGIEKIPGRQDPSKEILDHELGLLIRQELKKLPFQQQSTFTLRYFEGLSLQEIAETMGLSLGAVKAHLWQAQEKMKKGLSEWKPNPQVKL
ncbi:MAG: sigma-70 family RNA polymerase sigma factor [Candidatus Omnitrophica bacterium]|nr:sigma-70 family RNA polymerase sigma factor [Candidatus Omnitrophota bacterium]